MPDGVVSLPGFDVHRRDRVGRRGGGVLLWTNSDLKCTRRSDLQEWREDLWVEISWASCRPLIVACVYRPPDSAIKDFCDDLETSLSRVDLTKCDVIVLGDFNATSPTWLMSDPLSSAGAVLEPTTLQLGLHQLVPFATHLHPDGSLGSCIDLVFSSSSQCCQSVKSLPPLGSSDHVRIEFSRCFQPIVTEGDGRLRGIWSFDKADFQKLNSSLSSRDWSAVSEAATVNDAWKAWKEIFMSEVDKAIPSKVVSKSKPKLPWISTKLRELIKAKRTAWRAFKKSPTSEAQDTFRKIRNSVTSALRRAEYTYLQSLHRDIRLSNSATSTKSFLAPC